MPFLTPHAAEMRNLDFGELQMVLNIQSGGTLHMESLNVSGEPLPLLRRPWRRPSACQQQAAGISRQPAGFADKDAG